MPLKLWVSFAKNLRSPSFPFEILSIALVPSHQCIQLWTYYKTVGQDDL